MKIKIEYSINQYSDPPKPWCKVTIDGKHITSEMGDTWEEAKDKALAKAKLILHFGDIPQPDEVEI